MPRWPGFIGGSNTTQSLIADCEDTVNLYVEKIQSPGARHEAALLPTPGFRSWSTVTDVGSRCFFVANGRLFAVIGSGFYEFTSTAGFTKHGTVAQDGNPAQMVFNGVVGGHVGICSGGSVYNFVLATNTLSAALLTGGYTHLGYADGYGLAFNPTTGRVFLSNLDDLGTWSSNFFQRSKFPDPWQAMFVDPNSLIWLIGPETFEVWYDANPASAQPWAPLSGLYGRYGISAPFAYSVTGLGLYWLARSPEGGNNVVTTNGSAPRPISTYAVDTAIAGYQRTGRISDAEMLAYHDQGHTFPTLAFPSAGVTWAHDVEMEGWAKRGKWNPVTGAYGLWSPRVHADVFGKHLVGDRTSGTVWEMDTAIATDTDGTGIRRLRRAPGLVGEHQRIPIDQFELLMDVGLGTTSGAGSDPQAMLRVSQDGGRTWGNERRASIGRIGEYRKRVYWTRLGASPDAVVEVTWSDPSPVRVIDAWVNNAEKAA